MSHHKIEVKNLNFSYPDGNKVLEQIDFVITHGQSVGIVGANGSGKSTLLMLLIGVLFAENGEIIIGEIKLTKKTLVDIRRSIGFVFQNSDNQLFMPTVYDDVAYAPINFNLEPDDIEQKVTDALNAVGMLHLKNRAPYRLSGGEKKLVAIASVLSILPDVLIMDEPSAALDPKSRRNLINILNKFQHTKIIASHDLDMIYETCEQVIVLRDKTIIAKGETHAILTNQQLLESCNLELPLAFQSLNKFAK